MTYVLEYALALAAFGLAVWLPGYALERALAREPALGALRGLARICLGLGFWVACAFVLAAAGLLSRGPVAALALLGAASALAARLRWPGVPEPPGDVASRTAAFAGGAALVCLPLFVLAVGPSVSWDADTYHLTLPRLYIEAGGFRAVPMSVYSNWPLGTELLFALAMLGKDYVLAKTLHFGFGLLCVYAVFAGCRDHHRPLAGWVALPLFLVNEVVVLEFTVAYVDLALAFFLTAGFLFMLRAAERSAEGAGPDEAPFLLLSGMCCGLASGVKVTGIVAAGVVAVFYAPALREAARRGELGSRVLRFGTRFALPVLVLWLPWLAKAAWYTGNPVYPLLHGAFGGPDWSAELGESFRAWQRSIGMGRSALDYALLPLRVFRDGGPGYAHFDGRLHSVWLALVPLALVVGWRARLVRSALAAAALWFAAWSLGSQQMRFLIPMLPLLSMGCGVAAIDATWRLRDPRGRHILGFATFAAALALAVSANPKVVSAVGERLPLYAGDRAALHTGAVHPVYRYIDRQLPEDATLLLLDTNHGFFLRRAYLADSFFEASQIADWLAGARDAREAHQRLAARGVTHLLAARPKRGIPWPQGLRALLVDRERTRRRFRAEDGRFRLFELVREPRPE